LGRGRKAVRRLKPNLPIETHTQIGTLLKSVLAASYYRKCAYNNVIVVRSELDERVLRSMLKKLDTWVS